MNSNRKFRIHTDIGVDKKLDVSLQQNVGLLQILSLNLRQSDAYINKSSNYGVIVGRVLANDALGVENVKVSVFVPITDDYFVTRIRSVYPFRDITRRNGINNVRYNLLENEVPEECHADVGTFPNKRMVLDNNTYIEVFEKYYKYTTVTNKAGDYMIYGVPTGDCTVHIDLDLSNIGILSQKPRDFFYKGYNEELFKNPEQFKTSTNLDNLVQIISQNKGVNVYPFWGDEQNDTIAITRCDINVDYKFEPTCVFIGSMVTDEGSNSIGNRCLPARYVGKNSKLIAGEGTIEMIRKTQDGYVEEYNPKGGRLIDADGVWCYQIPMNLDYIQTDEEGHLIPSEDPAKGIATRARVRFRMTVDDMDSDGKSRHRAKYLVPNNPKIVNKENLADDTKIDDSTVSYDGDDLNKHYVFGSSTLEEDFRDLLWNKVYTVKSFIPRLVNGASKKHFLPAVRENSRAFVGIKSSNTSDSNNPFPYNSFMGTLSFSFRLICNIYDFLISLVCVINGIIKGLTKARVIRKIFRHLNCIVLPMGDNYVFYPCCGGDAQKRTEKSNNCSDPDIECSTHSSRAKQIMQEMLAQEFDAIDLDFGNDWVNGVLYFPLWHWLKKKKKKYFWGLFSKKAVDRFCNCDNGASNSLQYHYMYGYDSTVKTSAKSGTSKVASLMHKVNAQTGIVKQFYNEDNVDIYYYAPAVIDGSKWGSRKGSFTSSNDKNEFIRLFATDIVLIGSLVNNDLDGVSKLFRNLPTTTAHIPPLIQEREKDTDTTTVDTKNGINIPYETVLVSGLDEENGGSNDGVFFGLTCNQIYPLQQGPINAQRICELGVNIDETHYYPVKNGSNITYRLSEADALINKIEMYDVNSRAEFATYNSKPLICTRLNKQTGYKTYPFEFRYPMNFDGCMKGKHNVAKEFYSQSYLDFRFGSNKHFYGTDSYGYIGPVYDNSFYFYFGLTDGKTAIDKFRSMFYVDCVKDSELSFPVSVDIESKGKICRNEGGDDDYPKFSIDLTYANKPYELYITDAYGEEVFRVRDANSNVLEFDKYFNQSDSVGDVKVGGVSEENEIQPAGYILFVKDNFGKITNSTIDLSISEVQVQTEVTSFQQRSDTISGFDYDKSGNFQITGISINGDEITEVTDFVENSSISTGDVYDEYSVPFDFASKWKYWIVSINSEDYVLYIEEDGGYNITLHDKKFYIDSPATVTMKIEHLCPQGDGTYVAQNSWVGVTDNVIADYEPYKLTLNDVDVQDWTLPEEETGFNLKTNYSYPDVYTCASRGLEYKYWNDVIPSYDSFISDDVKRLSILAYKAKMLFNTCNLVYRTNTEGANVEIGYNCDSLLGTFKKSYAMYPTGSDVSEQEDNSITDFAYGITTSFQMDGFAPIYCQPYCYVVESSDTRTFTYNTLSTDDNGNPVWGTSTESVDLNKQNCKFTNTSLQKNKNSLYNGYSQSFGFYNCMVSSLSFDTDGNEKVVNSSPYGAKYTSGVLSDKENGSLVKNWFSYDDSDYRLGCALYLPISADGKCSMYGRVFGGLYLATEEHNVIGTGDTTTYRYSNDSEQLIVNTSAKQTLYDFSIGDIQIEFTNDITGDVVTNSATYHDVSQEGIKFTGTSLFQIVNNSWDIDLEASTYTDSNGNLTEGGLSGIVREGNSFTANIAGLTYMDNGVETESITFDWGEALCSKFIENKNYCNQEFDKNGNLLNITFRISNQADSSHCNYMGISKINSSEISTQSSKYNYPCDILSWLWYNYNNNNDVKTFYTVDGLFNDKSVVNNKDSVKDFAKNAFDISNSETYVNVNVSAKTITNKEFTVITKYFDSDWNQNHLMTEIYTFRTYSMAELYDIPFEQVNGYNVTGSSDCKYYYYDKTELGLKQITESTFDLGSYTNNAYEGCMVVERNGIQRRVKLNK